MKVKCGRVEYDLNEKDTVIFNGSLYMIITRRTRGNYWPVIAKTTAKRLIKEGKLEFTGVQKMTIDVDLYKINE